MANADSLNGLHGDALLNFVVEYAFEHVETLTELSVPLQTAYFIANFEAEFYNGGFQQFLTNSSGTFTAETSASFARIGARRIACLLSQCDSWHLTGLAADGNRVVAEINNQLHVDYPTNEDGNVGEQLSIYLEHNRLSIIT